MCVGRVCALCVCPAGGLRVMYAYCVYCACGLPSRTFRRPNRAAPSAGEAPVESVGVVEIMCRCLM